MNFPQIIAEIAWASEPLATPVWTDESDRFIYADPESGRTHEAARFEAGTQNVVFDNRDGRYNKWKTDGPYFGNIRPGKRIRLRGIESAVTYPISDMFIEDILYHYPGMYGSEVEFVCSDDFNRIANISSLAPHPLEVLARNPRGYWRFNDKPGSTVALDSSPNKRHGWFQYPAVMWTPAGGSAQSRVGYEFGAEGLLSGDDATALKIWKEDYAAVPTASGVIPNGGMVGTGAFSVSIWLRSEQINTAPSTQPIVMQAPGPILQDISLGRWALVVYASAGAPENYLIVDWGIYGAGSGVAFGLTSGALSSLYPVGADSRTHVVITRTGTTHKLYINGLLAHTRTRTADSWGTSRLEIPGGFSIADDDFQGSLQDLAYYESELTQADVTALYLAGSNPWANETSGVRIDRLLDIAGVRAADRDIDAGNTTLQAVDGVHRESLLAHAQKVEKTERGFYFLARDGKHTFLERHAVYKSPYDTPSVIYGDDPDNPAEVPYREITPDDRIGEVFNDFELARKGGPSQYSEDLTSQGTFGLRTLPAETDLLMDSDLVAKDLADFLKLKQKDDQVGIPKIEVPALNEAVPASAVLGLELIDLVRVIRRPENGGTLTVDAHIQKRRLEINARERTLRAWFDLFTADPNKYWLLGIAGYSELGQTTWVGH